MVESLLEWRLMGRASKFTLLGEAIWGLGGVAAAGWVGEIGARRQFLGLRDPGERPAEAVNGGQTGGEDAGDLCQFCVSRY